MKNLKSFINEEAAVTSAKEFVTEAAKDDMRLTDMVAKAAGNQTKLLALATQMANSITDKEKAYDRGVAAKNIIGGKDSIPIIAVFFNKAVALGKHIPSAEFTKTELEFTPDPYSSLTGSAKTAAESQGRDLSGRGIPVLPCGKLSFLTGQNKYFNVKTNGASCIEIYKVANFGDGDTKEGYRAVITSGNSNLNKIGSMTNFIHDQTGRDLFRGKLIDFVPVAGMAKLEKLYGKTMSQYVYK